MAVTATAGKQLAEQQEETPVKRQRVYYWPSLGVRARQIALITLLVVMVVTVTTIANIAYLTGVIIDGTEKQAGQIAKQITYAIQQSQIYNIPLGSNPYAELAAESSDVRRLMESILIGSRPITYLYLTNASGRIITDSSGKYELAINNHMIGDVSATKPDLIVLASESAYVQLYHVFFGEPVYEFRQSLTSDNSLAGELRIGISAATLRGEVLSPIATNIFIGLLAILCAAVVAISSANLLLKPLQAISTSIERIELGAEPTPDSQNLPRDHTVTNVATRLRLLGERLAGERSELELMRGRLRQVISHLEERLVLINREGRVILASPDAEQVLGIKDIDIAGLPIDEVLGFNHPLVQLVERSFSERRSVARTTLHVPGRTRPRQLLASVQFIEDAGEPVGALVSLRDYESFLKFESQWDLSKKLADLGRITSGIAHEVKNPLNAMVIHLEILRSKLDSGGDPSPQIEILDSEIKRLDRVVATFLNFTRPVEVRLQPLNLNSIVGQVIALAWTEAAENGVTINREIAEGPLMVKCDADLLKQALLNIIINGCQAMPEGGPLRVATFRGTDGSAHIKVSDRGVGIPSDMRDRIFNLYHTTKKGGSGIGLAQAYRAIQLHNGLIRFESEVGVGTTFEIVLPATD